MNCRTSVQIDNQNCSPIPHFEAVQQLRAHIQCYLPVMEMSLGQPSIHEFVLGQNNDDLIQGLYLAIQQSEPDAGRFYWSAQCWNMLCWQPIILSIVSASQFRLITDVNQMGQRVQGAGVAGLSIPHSAFAIAAESYSEHSDIEHKDLYLIRASGSKLRELLESLLALTAEHFPLNQNLARRLFADRMLSTLLLLQRLNNQGVFNEASNQHTEALAQHWLEATELQGASSLMRIEFRSDTANHTDTGNQTSERLALNRKGCCQHFRKSDGKVCASCPKNKMPERIQLIQQSWQ